MLYGLLCAAQSELPPPEGLKGNVYYISPLAKLPDFDRLEPVATIHTNPIDIYLTQDRTYPGIPNRRAWFAVDYQGNIYIQIPGSYQFRLLSDDGAKFYMDDQVVIDNDHGLGDFTGSRAMTLAGGMHRIRLSYLQGPQDHHCIRLQLFVTIPESGKEKPFDIRDFYPPTNPSDWKFGSPTDFAEAPDPTSGRVKLKDVVAHDNGIPARDLVALVRANLARKVDDRTLAKTLDKLTLNQKIDLTVIEELQSEGLGLEASQALERLRLASDSLHLDPELQLYAFPPKPSIEEQKRFFRSLSHNALNYTKSLPDFLCTESIERSTSPLGGDRWKRKDVLTVKLTYFGNREKYELTAVNGHKSGADYEGTGGAISEGEFGSQLLELFSPDTKTVFQWQRWTRFQGRLTQVFSFRTPRETSHYKVAVRAANNSRVTTTAGRHGFIYVDDETQMVLRVTGSADMPFGFPVIAQSNTLDYGFVEIGDQKYLVPVRSEQHMTSRAGNFRNIETFLDYRKFTGEAKISFTEPEN